ncbi:hypothetical protein [Pseudoalteromonas ruthenica]|uniref:hypothetical protein n=1 Tax=Pseudoalteromonas ruthenica TaxID=151081 RepID=UPI001108D3F6|nr:hypothetical protein [Pseudoalteromonas ruthenica]
MFIQTKEILEASESAFLGFSANRTLLKPAQRLFIYPFAYLRVGFGDFTKPMTIWSITSFTLLIIITLLSSGLDMSNEIYLTSFNICMLGALLLITFSTPSSYAFYGATEASVSTIVAIFDQNNIQKEEHIELLKDNIDRVEKRIEARVKFYKWIIASFWGLYFILVNLELRFASLSKKPIENDFLQNAFDDFLYVAFITALALLAMACYKRASDMLIANLQYACVEKKARLTG